MLVFTWALYTKGVFETASTAGGYMCVHMCIEISNIYALLAIYHDLFNKKPFIAGLLFY